MNVTLFYFSGTGNTKLLSERLVEALRNREVTSVECVPIEQSEESVSRLSETSLIGIACPVYDMKPPAPVMRFLKKLPKQSHPLPVFLFSTYTSYPLDCNYHMAEILQEKGYPVVAMENFKAPGASVFFFTNPDMPLVKGSTRFDKGIDAKLTSFAKTIMYQIKATPQNCTIEFHRFNRWHQKFSEMAFGFAFYRNLRVTEQCTGCGLCVKNCPDNNLGIINGTIHIEKNNNCVRCLRCMYLCPKDAISFTSQKRKGKYTRAITEMAFESSCKK